jgi:hypothetical protein
VLQYTQNAVANGYGLAINANSLVETYSLMTITKVA